jgi:hypothetical protein
MAMVPGATFRTIDEPKPGPKMAAIFAERAAAYDTWYLQDGDELRPSVAEGLDALRAHMPELIPIYEAMVREVRMAPARWTDDVHDGAAWRGDRLLAGRASGGWGRGPRLVRNYDYPAELMDAVILRSRSAIDR